MGNLAILRSAIPTAQVSSLTTGSITLPSARGTFDSGGFEAIASATATTGDTYLEFTNIPSGYAGLHLRCTLKGNDGAVNQGNSAQVRFNGDTGSNYVYSYLRTTGASNGTTSISDGGTQFNFYAMVSGGGTNAANLGVSTFDIFDYDKGDKYKLMFGSFAHLVGNTTTSFQENSIQSGTWKSLSAITSIRVTYSNGLANKSQIHLYGIKDS